MLEKIILAAPRGPCAGVNRAIDIVEMALLKYGSPIYVNHELVHNLHVVENLKKRGVVICHDPETLPENAVYLFSAHGVSPGFRAQIMRKNLRVIDATCPLVTKVHTEATAFAKRDAYIFYIGHRGHPEVEGTTGVTDMHLLEDLEDVKKIDLTALPQDREFAVLSQTTLSLDETDAIITALKKLLPKLILPKAGDICYATTNRQAAIKKLAEVTDFIAVVGSKNSSNSNRLAEAAKKAGTESLLIENFGDLPTSILKNTRILGISSGASVPEDLTMALVRDIKLLFPDILVETLEILKEDIRFSLPQI